MLIEAEPAVNEEADVILHAEEDDVLQGHDGQAAGILVVRPVDRVVEEQEFLLLPEEEAEKMVLESAVQAGMPPWKKTVQKFFNIEMWKGTREIRQKTE